MPINSSSSFPNPWDEAQQAINNQIGKIEPITTAPHLQTCPNCGYCPTCGRPRTNLNLQQHAGQGAGPQQFSKTQAQSFSTTQPSHYVHFGGAFL